MPVRAFRRAGRGESRRALALQAGESRIAFARSDFLLPELLRILRQPAARPAPADITFFV